MPALMQTAGVTEDLKARDPMEWTGRMNALKAQAEEILVKGHNSFAVDPETFDCDYYRFLQGDPAAVNAFQNDYMQSYSWAEIRNAELDFWEYREPERR